MTAPAPVDIGDDDFRGKVYFIFDNAANMVKIGFTTDLPKRFGDIKTGSSSELLLIDQFRAGRAVELFIHRFLSSERVRGEWFKYSGTTTDLLDAIGDFLLLETEDDETHILTVEEMQRIVADPTYGMDEEQAQTYWKSTGKERRPW